MDETQPVGKIKPQVFTNMPFLLQNVLFDDPTALFDDHTALFGGETTPISVLRASTSDNAPKGSIKLRR